VKYQELPSVKTATIPAIIIKHASIAVREPRIMGLFPNCIRPIIYLLSSALAGEPVNRVRLRRLRLPDLT
jgi:hypothetical protein